MLRVTNKKDLIKFKDLWDVSFLQNVDIDHLIWKYGKFDNSVINQVDDIFVSFYGGRKLKGLYNRDIIDFIQITDSCAHPDYRNHITFKGTVEFFYEKFNINDYLYYGFPGEKHYKIGKENLKYRDIGNQLNLYSIEKNLKSDNKNIKKVKDVDSLIKYKNDIFKLNIDYLNCSILRDFDFIKWRFFEKPRNSYKFNIHIDDNNLLGYLCYEKINNQYYIIDILYNKDINILISLISSIGDYKVNIYISDINIINQLICLGFKEEENTLGIKTVYRYNQIVEELYQTLADTDIF